MGHELRQYDSMAYTKTALHGVPWHGLGQECPESIGWGEFQSAAGLDWEVEKAEAGVYLDGTFYPSDTEKYTVAKKGEMVIPLGVVSDGYTVTQPQELFNMLSQFPELKPLTAGSLKNCKTLWVQAEHANVPTQAISEGDLVVPYIGVTTGLTGNSPLGLFSGCIRVVCNNTLTQAAGTGMVQVLRHTANMKSRMEDFQQGLEGVVQSLNAEIETFRILSVTPITEKQVQDVLSALYPVEGKKILTRTLNTRQNVEDLFRGLGMGATLKGSRGTAWGLYNALAQSEDYKGIGGKGNRKTFSLTRYGSNLLGSSAEFKNRALLTILQECEIPLS